jgi:Calcium binding
MDTYELLDFDDDVDPDSGIFINVQRVSDKKPFVLPLADLKATKKKSKNYQLLDDFSVWFVNWR